MVLFIEVFAVSKIRALNPFQQRVVFGTNNTYIGLFYKFYRASSFGIAFIRTNNIEIKAPGIS